MIGWSEWARGSNGGSLWWQCERLGAPWGARYCSGQLTGPSICNVPHNAIPTTQCNTYHTVKYLPHSEIPTTQCNHREVSTQSQCIIMHWETLYLTASMSQAQSCQNVAWMGLCKFPTNGNFDIYSFWHRELTFPLIIVMLFESIA